MTRLAPSLLLAPSESLPPGSLDPLPMTGSDGYTLYSSDPVRHVIEDIVFADSPRSGRFAFFGSTLTRREYADARPARIAHTGARSEQHERRATLNAFYGHAGVCAATTTRDEKYDEEALLVILARF